MNEQNTWHILEYASFKSKYEEEVPWSNPWKGHVAFAQLLVAEFKPQLLVELGTFRGVSFFSFCQSVKEHRLSTQCVAIDCWNGDMQSGFYDDSIYNLVKKYTDDNYPEFTVLKKMYFDDAIDDFKENSIDILHIDGLHTYDAVRHDFDTWLPKVKPGGIILFHDVNEYQETFGAYRLWDEIVSLSSETHLFRHSHGLGVWRKPGGEPLKSPILTTLFQQNSYSSFLIDNYTTMLAEKDGFHKKSDRMEKWLYEKEQELAQSQDIIKNQTEKIADLEKILKTSQEEFKLQEKIFHESIAMEQRRTQSAEEAQSALLNSRSMKLTSPLRSFANAVRRMGKQRKCNFFSKLFIALCALPAAISDHGITAFSFKKNLYKETLDNKDTNRFKRYGVFSFLWEFSFRIASAIRTYGGIFPAVWSKRHSVKIYCTFVRKTLTSPKRFMRGIHYASTHGWKAAFDKAYQTIVNQQALEPIRNGTFNLRCSSLVGILTTQHCVFVAKLIQQNLKKVGIDSEIFFEYPVPDNFSGPYFVICPQMFSSLPEQYIAVQMEQSVSSRWFTEDYFSRLKNAYAILDYSLANIDFMLKSGISFKQVFYTPLAFLEKEDSLDRKDKDILFYGDTNCPRRQKFLHAIQEKYPIKIVNNLFGNDMQIALHQTKIIVNIHYYEGALLETTRIYEALSEGCLVISEKSTDSSEYPELESLVDFVEIGDISAMCERIDYWLSDPDRLSAKLEENKEKLKTQPNRFEYFFMRFLLAHDIIDFNTFYSVASHNITFNGSRVCLGLPESIERHNTFDADNTFGFEYFPGLRHSIGWVGCGMSHKFILRRLLDLGCEQAIVCEDDVDFLPGWDKRLSVVLEYLQNKQGEWDIFSGLNADVHSDAQILQVESYKGIEFITMDKTVSTVLNIYPKSFCKKMQNWDDRNHHVENTIDRFIESLNGLRVITTHPYLIGHKEELSSTLWGIGNDVYKDLIQKSNKLLKKKIDNWKNR